MIHSHRDGVSGELTQQTLGGLGRPRDKETGAAARLETFQPGHEERREERQEALGATNVRFRDGSQGPGM